MSVSIPRSAEEARELLESVVDDLQDVKARMNAFSTWKEHTNDRIDDLEQENDQLTDVVESLQSRIEIIEDGATSKEGKVRKIVQYGENAASNDQDGVVVSAREIKGAAGVSRRYAYDLVDDLPEEYHWILTREEARSQTYGNLEIDGGSQTKAVVIDFELLHNDPEAVNKFTTARGAEEGST